MEFIRRNIKIAAAGLAAFVAFQFFSSFRDEGGNNVGWVKPLMILTGTIACLALAVIFLREYFLLIKRNSEREQHYWAWYSTLTLEQQQLEDIRRNTAEQAREVARLREIVEYERRRRDT